LKKNTWSKFEFSEIAMLTKLPTHAVCSALYFQNFSAVETVAKPHVWSFTQKELVREDEDWVFV